MKALVHMHWLKMTWKLHDAVSLISIQKIFHLFKL